MSDDDGAPKPRIVRTYGSRRAEPVASANTELDAVPTLRHDAPSKATSLASRRRSPSPFRDVTTPSPSKTSSAADASEIFDWKARLRDIDDGKEDDNLASLIGARNASRSPSPPTQDGRPKSPPLFSATPIPTPEHPTTAPRRNLGLASQHRPLLSPQFDQQLSDDEDKNNSPNRTRISQLSLSSPEPDSALVKRPAKRKKPAREYKELSPSGEKVDDNDSSPEPEPRKSRSSNANKPKVRIVLFSSRNRHHITDLV